MKVPGTDIIVYLGNHHMAHMTWVWSYGPYDGTIHHLFQTHMQQNSTSSLEYDGLLRLKS